MGRYKEIEQKLNEKRQQEGGAGSSGAGGKGKVKVVEPRGKAAKARESAAAKAEEKLQERGLGSATGTKWEVLPGGEPPKKGKLLDHPPLAAALQNKAKEVAADGKVSFTVKEFNELVRRCTPLGHALACC